MAMTPSTMVPLGTRAPDFNLPNTQPGGGQVSRASLEGKPLAVLFICNHCPFVKHIARGLAAFGRDYAERAAVVAISSNDVSTHPQDGPEHMTAEAQQHGWTFPYLYDETQEVAKAYQAACTPDFFVFDAQHKLVYRGQFDASRPGNQEPVTGTDLRAALDAALGGQPAAEAQIPSIGCNIKWKAGNAPSYA